MPEREKVMKGLNVHLKELSIGKSCGECPYVGEAPCEQMLIADALALLKEQEARVMTRDEIIAMPEGAVVWFEEHADDSRDYIGPLVSDGNGYFGDFGRGVDMHAVEWKRKRCWTSRPTDEQRKAVPWDESCENCNEYDKEKHS